MADGTNYPFPKTSLQTAYEAQRPALRVVESHPQANAYGFAPVADLPRQRFMPADDGAVRLGVARLSPETVEELLRLFEREAGRTGDWDIYQDLLNARDGIVEPPPSPEAA